MQAYERPDDNVYLIIEEINRGNCAQIFGDLFQLLDRDENGVSEYTIKADADLRAFLEEELGKERWHKGRRTMSAFKSLYLCHDEYFRPIIVSY